MSTLVLRDNSLYIIIGKGEENMKKQYVKLEVECISKPIAKALASTWSNSECMTSDGSGCVAR